jgi:hypothetical protein
MSRLSCLLVAVALLSACAGPASWWQRDLQEWQGASISEVLEAWGPPMRTLQESDGEPVLVYETIRVMDPRMDALRDPGARLGDDPIEGLYIPPDRTECTMHFVIESERVSDIRHEGAGCRVVPRDPARRRSDPQQ